MAVTARQVAKEAGVSPATVSLVFRNKPGVGQETRDHVREVAQRLGYEYHGPISPVEGRGATLQLVAYKSHGKVVGETAFFEQLMAGVSDEAYVQGFPRLEISYYYAKQDPKEQLKALRSTKCAGIILLATEMRSTDVSAIERLGVPVVLLDGWFLTKNLDAVVIDNQRGALNATNYLVRHGHRDIGYLHSSVDIRNFLERQDGWIQAVRTFIDHDYDFRSATVRVGTTVVDAREDMAAYLASGGHVPTAFFADNDIIAAGCIRALQDAGYRVPEDVSVIGLDDMPFAQIMDPALTTMAVPKQRMGALAVQRLVSLIHEGRREIVRTAVLPEIVERASVKQLG